MQLLYILRQNVCTLRDVQQAEGAFRALHNAFNAEHPGQDHDVVMWARMYADQSATDEHQLAILRTISQKIVAWCPLPANQGMPPLPGVNANVDAEIQNQLQHQQVQNLLWLLSALHCSAEAHLLFCYSAEAQLLCMQMCLLQHPCTTASGHFMHAQL